MRSVTSTRSTKAPGTAPLFDAATIEPIEEQLAGLAGDGRALEFAIGRVRHGVVGIVVRSRDLFVDVAVTFHGRRDLLVLRDAWPS